MAGDNYALENKAEREEMIEKFRGAIPDRILIDDDALDTVENMFDECQIVDGLEKLISESGDFGVAGLHGTQPPMADRTRLNDLVDKLEECMKR